jgi:hypothetical protein
MSAPATFSIPRSILGGVLGGVAGGILNVPIYFVGRMLGATYVPNDTSYFPMLPWFHLVIPSIVAGIGASVVFAVVALATRRWVWPVFLGISALVFLGYLYPPVHAFSDFWTVVALQASHVSAAALVLSGIYVLGHLRPGGAA